MSGQKNERRKRRRFRKLRLLAPLFAAIAVSTVAAAYMIRQTPYAVNEFVPAQVECEVSEIVSADGTAKTSIKVQNTKNSNIDAYLRLRIVSYWEDGSGKIVAKESQVPDVTPGAGWLKGSDGIYYYQTAVEPEAYTGELLGSALELEKGTFTSLDEDQEEKTIEVYQVVEVFAEAIQAEPGSAVSGSWGVTLDADGRIAAVP